MALILPKRLASGGGDRHFSNVSLLLPLRSHFRDESRAPNAVAVNGDSRIVNGAAYFDDAGDNVSGLPFAASYGEYFTLELWHRLTYAGNVYQDPFSAYPRGLRYGDSGFGYKLQVSLDFSSQSTTYSCALTQQNALGKWLHLAFVRGPLGLGLFVNGRQQDLGSGANPSSYPYRWIANPDSFSANATAAGNSYQGYLRDVRYTRGIARYLSDFSPPDSLPTHGVAASPSGIILLPSEANSAGLAEGAATVTGVGASRVAAAGFADGLATVTGVGDAYSSSGVGLAEGTATATGVGAATVAASGAADGVATATGVGSAYSTSGVGLAEGSATVTGVGAGVAIIGAEGYATGSATVVGVGARYNAIRWGITLDSVMRSQSLGVALRLSTHEAGAIAAQIALASVADSIAAGITLVTHEPGVIAVGLTLQGPVETGAAALALRWQPVVLIDGVDVSARLTGAITIEREEDASALAELLLAPTAGPIDPLLYVAKPVQIWWAELVGGVESYRRLRYTGIVADAAWDATRKVVALSCTTDLQNQLNRMDKAAITTLIGGRWSSHVWSDEDSTGWTYAQQRLSTIPSVIWHDETGAIRVTDFRAKATADLSLDAGDILDDSLVPDYANRGDMINVINAVIDYRYLRKRQRWVDFVWPPDVQVCTYLSNNAYQLCQRSMVESAVGSGGWSLVGEIEFVPIWPRGQYSCSAGEQLAWFYTDEDAAGLCIGASWRATKRWHQTVTDTYTLRISAPQSIAGIGEVPQTEEYGIESAVEPDTAWEESTALDAAPGGRISAAGDWLVDTDEDEDAGRAALEEAQECIVAAAQADILRAHRLTTLRFGIPFQPALSLDHTLYVNALGVEAQGKVRALRDTLDTTTGEAVTEVELALSRRNGSGLVDTTPPAAVDRPDDPDETDYAPYVRLGLHIGGRTLSPPYDETWDGLITNYQYDPNVQADYSADPRNPAVPQYPYSFVVPAPEIDSAYTEAAAEAPEAEFTVDIPEDLLTITA